MGRSESRQKTETIGVRCTPEEKAALKARADAFGISVGALCRDTIFGAKPKSKTDQNAIDELALTRADLGRLGGLLKGWLAGVFEEVGTPTVDTMPMVSDLLREVQEAQLKVLAAVSSLAQEKK